MNLRNARPTARAIRPGERATAGLARFKLSYPGSPPLYVLAADDAEGEQEARQLYATTRGMRLDLANLLDVQKLRD